MKLFKKMKENGELFIPHGATINLSKENLQKYQLFLVEKGLEKICDSPIRGGAFYSLKNVPSEKVLNEILDYLEDNCREYYDSDYSTCDYSLEFSKSFEG